MKLTRRRRHVAPAPPASLRPFTVRGEETDYGRLVTVTGELDIGTAPQLRDAVVEHPPAGGLLVVDLTPVTFMDSTGLGVLIKLHKALLAAGSRLAVVVPPGPARLLLDVTGLDSELTVFDRLDEAVSA